MNTLVLSYVPIKELDLIYDIAERVAAPEAFSDLALCHACCCPLRLRELFEAPIMDAVRDVLGIRKNLVKGRRGHILRSGYMPKYAAATEAA